MDLWTSIACKIMYLIIFLIKIRKTKKQPESTIDGKYGKNCKVTIYNITNVYQVSDIVEAEKRRSSAQRKCACALIQTKI
jgi:hypothetical protein